MGEQDCGFHAERIQVSYPGRLRPYDPVEGDDRESALTGLSEKWVCSFSFSSKTCSRVLSFNLNLYGLMG